MPVLAYNLWAFGSRRTISYEDAVDRQGFTGHAALGLNYGASSGSGCRTRAVALELLFARAGCSR